MKDRALLATGIAGSVVTVLCCVTPILAIGLGAAGLAAWLGWLDYVLFPTLMVFLGLTAYAWVGLRRRSTATPCCDAAAGDRPVRG